MFIAKSERDVCLNEIVRLQGDEELFTFVKFPEATGTNNTGEQALRQSAQDRKTCRASKTLNGARRRTMSNRSW